MDEPSLLSDVKDNQLGEISDSSSTRSCLLSPARDGGPLSKFRGVVTQSNGHWGAQIYANHKRIWLGTFKSENEAAMAYDSAAIKLRNGVTNRNLPWTNITVREPSFQSQFSTETILSMIKDGSYFSKFADYLRTQDQERHPILAPHETVSIKTRLLFQKELTPSDVSKLNRLVIPKKYALKFFPKIVDLNEKIRVNNGHDVELVFYDRAMRKWNFRYCYWHSSQTFVFTRGWNSFTKEKELKAKDKVIFSCYDHDHVDDRKMLIIDVEYDVGGKVMQDIFPTSVKAPPVSDDVDEMESGGELVITENVTEESPSPCAPKKVVRLFGVDIC